MGLCENAGIVVTLAPKPIPGDWAGSGCHANFSTAPMREQGGMRAIEEAIDHLAKFTEFKYGVGDRSGSVRIPQHVADAGKGYLEDRRPSSDCDPYKVTDLLVCTCLLHTTKPLN